MSRVDAGSRRRQSTIGSCIRSFLIGEGLERLLGIETLLGSGIGSTNWPRGTVSVLASVSVMIVPVTTTSVIQVKPSIQAANKGFLLKLT
jgi:hypothetical protein